MENEELSPGPCPDDELLAGLIENRVDEITRVALERHVAVCPVCADVVAAVATSAHDPSLPTTDQPPVEVRATRTRFPAGRRGLALAASLALTTTAVLGYAGSVLLLDRGARELSRHASALVGQPVAVGRMAVGVGSDLRTLTLHLADVHVGVGGSVSGSAAGMEVALAIASLWRGAMAVEHVRLIRPVMSIGEQPPAAPTAEQERSRGRRALDLRTTLSAVFTGSRLEITNGTLVVHAPDGPPLTVTRLGITSAPTADGFRILLSGTLAGGSATVDAVVAADATGTLTVNAYGHDLTLAALPYARAWLSGVAECHLSATGSTKAPRLAGRVRVRTGQALAWNPLPTLFEQAGTATLAGLAPRLVGGALPFDELNVTIAAHRGDWRLRRVHVAGAGVTTIGELRVTSSRSVNGVGDIHLPPALAASVLTAVPRLAARRQADGGVTLPYAIGGTIDLPQFTPRF